MRMSKRAILRRTGASPRPAQPVAWATPPPERPIEDRASSPADAVAHPVCRRVRKCVGNCATASQNRLAPPPNRSRVDTLFQDLRAPVRAVRARNYALRMQCSAINATKSPPFSGIPLALRPNFCPLSANGLRGRRQPETNAREVLRTCDFLVLITRRSWGSSGGCVPAGVNRMFHVDPGGSGLNCIRGQTMYVCHACGSKMSALQPSCPGCRCLFANYQTVQRRLAQEAQQGQSKMRRNRLCLSLAALTVLVVLLVRTFHFI